MADTYTVTTIDADARQVEVGVYADKVRAMNAAKRAARTRKDCEVYGPASLCYVGKDATAVVAW